MRTSGLFFAADHPNNLFLACGLCETSFYKLRIAVNVFASPPRMIVADSPPPGSPKEALDAFDRICTPGKPVDLKTGPYEERYPNMAPSEALFAMHLVAFLARRCRIARPVPQPAASYGPSSEQSGWALLTESAVEDRGGPDAEVVDIGTRAEKDHKGGGSGHRNLTRQGDQPVDPQF